MSPPPVRPYPLCLCTGSLSLPCGHLLVTQRIVTQFGKEITYEEFRMLAAGGGDRYYCTRNEYTLHMLNNLQTMCKMS